MKLKNKLPTEPYDIPSYLLHRILYTIVKPFTYFINLPFCLGKFPQELKLGKIIPVYKKKNKQNISNYWPVTITSSFSKVFKYCFLKRFLSYLESNNTISNFQHQFCPNESTVTGLHNFYENLLLHLESGECYVGLFCDLSKAFNCIQHNSIYYLISQVIRI